VGWGGGVRGGGSPRVLEPYPGCWLRHVCSACCRLSASIGSAQEECTGGTPVPGKNRVAVAVSLPAADGEYTVSGPSSDTPHERCIGDIPPSSPTIASCFPGFCGAGFVNACVAVVHPRGLRTCAVTDTMCIGLERCDVHMKKCVFVLSYVATVVGSCCACVHGLMCMQVVVRPRDGAGNTGDSAEFTFVRDTTRPVLTASVVNIDFSQPVNTTVNGTLVPVVSWGKVDVLAVCDDASPCTVTLTVTLPSAGAPLGNSSVEVKSTDPSLLSVLEVPDGLFDAVVTAVDAAGNVASERWTLGVLVDTQAPTSVIVAPGPESWQSSSSATFSLATGGGELRCVCVCV
jgi:hypothetical protein